MSAQQRRGSFTWARPFSVGALLLAACEPPAARVEPGVPAGATASVEAPPAPAPAPPPVAVDDRERVPLLSPDTVPLLPVLWSHPTKARPLVVAHPEGPAVVLLEEAPAAIALLDAASGSVRWRRAAGKDDSWDEVAATGEGVITVVGNQRAGRQLLVRFAVNDGALLHRDELPRGYAAGFGTFGTGLLAQDHEHCTTRFRAGTGVFVGPVLEGRATPFRGLDGGPDGHYCSREATVFAEVSGVTVAAHRRDGHAALSGFGAAGRRWSLTAGAEWFGLASRGKEAIFLHRASSEPGGEVAFVRIDLATGKIRWEHVDPRRDPCPSPDPSLRAAPSAERVPGLPGHPDVLLTMRCGAALALDADTGERLWERKGEGIPIVVGEDPLGEYGTRTSLAKQGDLDWLLPDGSRVPRAEPPRRASQAVIGADGLLLVEGDVHTMVEPSGRLRWQVRAEIDEATWHDGVFALQTKQGLALIEPGTGFARFAVLSRTRWTAPDVILRAGRSDVWILWRKLAPGAFAVRFSR